MYLDYVIMIGEDFLFTSRLVNYPNYPISVMENASLKYYLMPLNIAVEPLIMSKSSTHRILTIKNPPFYFMETL